MKTRMTTIKRPRVMTWATMILAGFALLMTTLPAAAQCCGGQAHGDSEFSMGPRLAGLDLTDEQQKQVNGIAEQRQATGLKLRAEQTRLQAELHAEMLKENPNTDRLYELVGKMTKVHGELQKNKIDQHLAIGKILTAEQRAKMTAMAGRGHGGMGGPCMGRGGCDAHGRGGKAMGCGPQQGAKKAAGCAAKCGAEKAAACGAADKTAGCGAHKR